MPETWREVVAGDRLAVDREFEDRLRSAGLGSQEWGLVMTAVEFEIDGPEDPETARLVADTSRVDAVLPELERVRGQTGGPAGPEAGAADGGDGLLDRLRGLLGLGGDDRRATVERLAEEYADRLQDRLEERGRWETVCSMAAD